MIPTDKKNKMLGIYSKINTAKLIKTPAVSSPQPIETEVYKDNVPVTWNNPTTGKISANSYEFEQIPIGSQPNCLVLYNSSPSWEFVTTEKSSKLYFKSTYDILMSNPVADTTAIVGYKSGGNIVYDYILYQVGLDIYNACSFKLQWVANGLQASDMDSVYELVYDSGWDGSPPIVGHKIDNGSTNLYFVQKSARFETAGNLIPKYELTTDTVYSLAINLDDHKNEELIFTAVSSITIPSTNIELKEEV